MLFHQKRIYGFAAKVLLELADDLYISLDIHFSGVVQFERKYSSAKNLLNLTDPPLEWYYSIYAALSAQIASFIDIGPRPTFNSANFASEVGRRKTRSSAPTDFFALPTKTMRFADFRVQRTGRVSRERVLSSDDIAGHFSEVTQQPEMCVSA